MHFIIRQQCKKRGTATETDVISLSKNVIIQKIREDSGIQYFLVTGKKHDVKFKNKQNGNMHRHTARTTQLTSLNQSNGPC